MVKLKEIDGEKDYVAPIFQVSLPSLNSVFNILALNPLSPRLFKHDPCTSKPVLWCVWGG